MMGHLLAIKEKQSTSDDLFGPLQSTIELLKTYGQELADEVYLQLQVKLPVQLRIGYINSILYL